MPRLGQALAIFFALIGAPACGTRHVARGADLYAGGRYIEAAEVFERTETRLADCTSEERARYGLYRGATLLALGDGPHARRWLAYSEGILRADGRALSNEERGMLSRALAVLASYVPPAPGPAAPSDAAVAGAATTNAFVPTNTP